MKRLQRLKNIRFFTVCVLLILLGAALNLWGGEKNPLLDKGGTRTLYITIASGEELNLQASQYFEEGLLDETRITYDTSKCDTENPGIYQVPVLYDGKATNCVFEVTVEESSETLYLDLQASEGDKNTEKM